MASQNWYLTHSNVIFHHVEANFVPSGVTQRPLLFLQIWRLPYYAELLSREGVKMNSYLRRHRRGPRLLERNRRLERKNESVWGILKQILKNGIMENIIYLTSHFVLRLHMMSISLWSQAIGSKIEQCGGWCSKQRWRFTCHTSCPSQTFKQSKLLRFKNKIKIFYQ